MTDNEKVYRCQDNLWKIKGIATVLCEMTSEGKADDDIAAMVLVLLDEVKAAQEAIAN